MGYRVRGVDLAEGMLERARTKASEQGLDARFEVGDAMDPGGEAESVDAVVSRHVFWSLTEPRRALRNWLALLRPGGRLAIIDGLWSLNAQAEHRLEFQDSLPMTKVTSMDDVKAIVRSGGFVDVAEADLGEVARVERERFGKTEEARYVITAAKPGAVP
jgi:SAM-dependent methyltransferase